MLDCVTVWSVGVVHESTEDSYGMRNIRPCRDHCVHQGAYYRCIRYRLHIFPLRTGCRALSLRKSKINGERGRSRLGRLHVEAFQDTSNVVGLRQKQSSFIAIPTNLHVGDEAISAEVQATFLMMMNLCRSRNKIHRYGERERHKRRYVLCQ